MIGAKVRQYQSYGEKLDGYQAKEELLADAVGKLLESEGAIDRLVRYDQGLFQKVRYWVEDMIARFKGTPEESRFLQAQKLLERAVAKSTGVLSSGNLAGAYFSERDTVYSINANFEREYDAWDKDPNSGGYFALGTASEPLKSIGVIGTNIRWDKQKISKILRDHPEMTDDIIKKVPQILEDPVLIFQDNMVNTITLVSDVVANNNKPVMVSLLLRRKGRDNVIQDILTVRTAFTKENWNTIFKERPILYANPNKKRTDTLLQALGHQLPSGGTQYGSTGRVTYSDTGVNSYSSKPDIEAQRQEELRRSELIAEYNRRLGFSDDPSGSDSLGGELDDLSSDYQGTKFSFGDGEIRILSVNMTHGIEKQQVEHFM